MEEFLKLLISAIIILNTVPLLIHLKFNLKADDTIIIRKIRLSIQEDL